MMMLGGGGEAMGMAMMLAETSGGGGGGGAGGGAGRGKEERLPQWSQQETREFIAIRAELERDFTMSKRNKTLWEVVAARMRERGFRRSPDQCKCKWKNLVNRYKGKETSDPETGRQCPFFEELHAIFTERERNMQRLLESESGAPQLKKKLKRLIGDRSSEEFSEDDVEEDEDSEDERLSRSKKKKAGKGGQQHPRAADKSKMSSSIYDLLQTFFQQQQRMDMQWREMMETRAQERMHYEHEWRQSMEKLERERLMLEQAWREREEQRRIREESRAEKRDALLTTLLNKLVQEGL